MKIILTQSVETLGNAGDIVNVKPGYGRNYLIPRGLGVLATPSMVRATKQDIERKVIKEAKSKDNLQIIADKLNTVKLTFSLKAGEDDKLFVSVTSSMIAEEIINNGYSLDKKDIIIEDSIKTIGNHFVNIRLSAEINAKIKIKVSPEK